MFFNIITWDLTPEIVTGWSVPNWYGISWALSFILGYQIIKKIFNRDNAPKDWSDKILMYMLIAGILGARLGHVFFYDWDQYKDNLIEILYIWEGGLASHGGAIGILIALFIFSKKVTKKSMLWVLDRVVICVAIASCFIRIGNLVNHEIVGHPSDKGLAMVFTRHFEEKPDALANFYGIEKFTYDYEKLEGDSLYNQEAACPEYKVTINLGDANQQEAAKIVNDLKFDYHQMSDSSMLANNLLSTDLDSWKLTKGKEGRTVSFNAYLIPRHPAQLYESISYLLLFAILWFMFWKKDAQKKPGLLFGVFLIVCFGARFGIEFLKVKQSDNTADQLLNMGHWLSVPFVIIGLFFIVRALMKGNVKETE